MNHITYPQKNIIKYKKKKGQNILECTTDRCPLTATTFQNISVKKYATLWGPTTKHTP